MISPLLPTGDPVTDHPVTPLDGGRYASVKTVGNWLYVVVHSATNAHVGNLTLRAPATRADIQRAAEGL